eukprot:UN27127
MHGFFTLELKNELTRDIEGSEPSENCLNVHKFHGYLGREGKSFPRKGKISEGRNLKFTRVIKFSFLH